MERATTTTTTTKIIKLNKNIIKIKIKSNQK